MSRPRDDDYWEQVAEARAEDWAYTPPAVAREQADRAADRHETWITGEGRTT